MTLIAVIFLLLAVYQLKHFLADYIFQGEYMLGKFKGGTDWILPLLAHVGVHGALTLVIVGVAFPLLNPHMLFDTQTFYALGIVLFDGTVHFLMDRLKAGPRWMGRWKPVTAAEYVDLSVRAKLTDEECRGFDWEARKNSKKRLLGNKLFWWALGFDQAVHHLTHYACIYFILKAAGVL